MRSVHDQTYRPLQHIVIDGASTDGTQRVIERYVDELHHYRSGPDLGVYDAMNKGCAVASGDYVVMLNADDYFLSETGVADVVDELAECELLPDLAVAKTRIAVEETAYPRWELPEGGHAELGYGYPHQSTLIHRRVYSRTSYDPAFRSCGDLHLWRQLRREGTLSVRYCSTVLSVFVMGGVSNYGHELRRAFERAMSVYLLEGTFHLNRFLGDVAKAAVRSGLQKALGMKIYCRWVLYLSYRYRCFKGMRATRKRSGR